MNNIDELEQRYQEFGTVNRSYLWHEVEGGFFEKPIVPYDDDHTLMYAIPFWNGESVVWRINEDVLGVKNEVTNG